MIKLTNDLYISSDERQYILGKPRQRSAEGGERITLDFPTYHAKIADALKAATSRIIRDKVADGSITTLNEYITELRQINDEFTQKLLPLELESEKNMTK